MKRIYIVFILLIGISISCTDNFEDFNTDTKHPPEVPGDFLFTNAQKALADQVASTNVNLNIWKLVAQYWTETTYTDEANYDIVNRTIPDLIFRTYYRDILADLNNAKSIITGEEAITDEDKIAKQNKLYIIDLMNAYCYNRLVDIFGDVPYKEALNIDNISPVYDDGFGIYQSLLNNITTAVNGLDVSAGSFGGGDLYFNGDVSMWKKFGNSLKVKMGITLADFDANLAQSTVESAYQGAFASDERCELVYLGGSNSNPLYVDLVQSGRHDFVAANTIIDKMNALEDPRREAYFADNIDSAYVGGTYGESSPFGNYTHIADPIQEPTFPITLISGMEVEFYLAEAAARGYSVGSANEHYQNAIESSFTYWNASGASDYLAKAEVALPSNASWSEEVQQKIATQAWIAFYLNGLVAWTEWRRLDYPTLNVPPSPFTEDGQVPKRFTYPVNEQTLNAANYKNAADAIGGDMMSNKLFWDVN